MTSITLTDNNINRRLAARIYQQCNLFYRKIETEPPADQGHSFESLLTINGQSGAGAHGIDSLPDSQSQENATLNVNISASGIAFTCQEQLRAGDHLLLRILLLANMTLIMTSCRVVYCRPSNPFETDRYRYLIGAEFVNLTADDRKLLEQHVHQQKLQQRVLFAPLLALALAILVFPLEMLHLLFGVIHHLIGLVFHSIFLGFEFLEMSLDHLIEHLFHTDLHATQIIVFYLLVSMALTLLYFIGKRIPTIFRTLINQQRLFWWRKKSSLLYYWEQQSFVDKVRILGISAVAILAYVFVAF